MEGNANLEIAFNENKDNPLPPIPLYRSLKSKESVVLQFCKQRDRILAACLSVS